MTALHWKSRVRRLLGRGRPIDVALDMVRGERPSVNFYGGTPVEEGRIAGNFGPGWRLQNGFLGSGAMVLPDSDEEALAWSTALGRSPRKRDKDAWLEYCERRGVPYQDAQKTWQRLVYGPTAGAYDWDTFSGDQSGSAVAPESGNMGGAEGGVGESTETRVDPTWIGYSTPPAVTDVVTPNSGAQPQIGPDDLRGFSYRTDSAKLVWKAAQMLVGAHPDKQPMEIVNLALEKAGVSQETLAPEDVRMLEMGVEWLQNGPPPPTTRSAGAPGGPFRQSSTRGAP